MKKFTVGEVAKCFNFAKGMSGKHRPDFAGGPGRNDKEIFLNDIQGKLAEIAVRKEIKRSFPFAKIDGEIDFDTYERGRWDNYDLKVNGKYLSIKSIKHFSVVLMVECDRYDANGKYSYKNNNNDEIINDYYILVKIKIIPTISWEDLKRDFSYFKEPFEDPRIKEHKIKREIRYEVLGGISHDEFWKSKLFIPKDTVITVKNMSEYLVKGKPINSLSDNKGEKLKVNNYAVHKDRLKPLNELEFIKNE